MNIIILLTNFTFAQPDVTQTTVEMLQSDWAATIVAAKTNPDIGLKPYLPSGTVGLRPTSAWLAIHSGTRLGQDTEAPTAGQSVHTGSSLLATFHFKFCNKPASSTGQGSRPAGQSSDF